jgi:O-antigen ligase
LSRPENGLVPGLSAASVVRAAAVRDRLLPIVVVGIVSIAAADSIAGMDKHVPKLLVLVLALAGAAVLLAVETTQLFLGWLFVAPIFQGSASTSHLGHVFSLALYSAPPALLLVKHFTVDGPRPARKWYDGLPALYLLFLVGSLLITASGELQHGALGTLHGLWQNVAIGIVIYYVVAFWPGGGPSVVTVAKVLLLAAALQAVMAVVELATHWNLWHDTRWQRAGGDRSIATLANPAITGAFIGVGIVIALALLCWGGPVELRRLAVVMLVIGGPALYATKTRGPILGTLVAALLVLIPSRRSRLFGLGAIALTALTLVVLWPHIRSSSLYQNRIAQSQNVQERLVLQDISFKLIERKPVLGSGYDSFDRVKYDVPVSTGALPYVVALKQTSHDTFLTILIEYGAVGFLLLLLPWIPIVAGGLRCVRTPAPDQWFLVAMLASIVLLVINAATLDYRFFSFVPGLAWLALAFLRRRLSGPVLT